MTTWERHGRGGHLGYFSGLVYTNKPRGLDLLMCKPDAKLDVFVMCNLFGYESVGGAATTRWRG
jgi:hypothetical protein